MLLRSPKEFQSFSVDCLQDLLDCLQDLHVLQPLFVKHVLEYQTINVLRIHDLYTYIVFFFVLRIEDIHESKCVNCLYRWTHRNHFNSLWSFKFNKTPSKRPFTWARIDWQETKYKITLILQTQRTTRLNEKMGKHKTSL